MGYLEFSDSISVACAGRLGASELIYEGAVGKWVAEACACSQVVECLLRRGLILRNRRREPSPSTRLPLQEEWVIQVTASRHKRVDITDDILFAELLRRHVQAERVNHEFMEDERRYRADH